VAAWRPCAWGTFAIKPELTRDGDMWGKFLLTNFQQKMVTGREGAREQGVATYRPALITVRDAVLGQALRAADGLACGGTKVKVVGDDEMVDHPFGNDEATTPLVSIMVGRC